MKLFLTGEGMKKVLDEGQEIVISWGGRSRKIIGCVGNFSIELEAIPTLEASSDTLWATTTNIRKDNYDD